MRVLESSIASPPRPFRAFDELISIIPYPNLHSPSYSRISCCQELDVDAYLRESVERYAEFLRGARTRFAQLELAAVSVLLPVVQAAWLFESLKFYTRSSHDPEQQRKARSPYP